MSVVCAFRRTDRTPEQKTKRIGWLLTGAALAAALIGAAPAEAQLNGEHLLGDAASARDRRHKARRPDECLGARAALTEPSPQV